MRQTRKSAGPVASMRPGLQSRNDLVDKIKGIGAVRSRPVEEAFRTVDQGRLLPPALEPFAYMDAPAPYDHDFPSSVSPSLQVLAAMLEVLELEAGVRTAVVGGGPYPAALVAAIVGDVQVALVEADPGKAARFAAALGDQQNLRVVKTLEADWDRLWFPGPNGDHEELERCLADMGFVVARRETPQGPALLKRLRSGGEFLELSIQQLPASEGGRGFDVARSLAIDSLMVHAWQGRGGGPYDEHFAHSVQETFGGGALDPEVAPDTVAKAAARKTFQVAYILQSSGELRRAEDAYERSIVLFPSAEAYTFLGWTYSFEGRYDEAIEACHRAIASDPAFGNPYNDIGAYLIELGRNEEAIPWLEKAAAAPRYCCPFYAHTNLGRAYLALGRPQLARRHLVEAIKVKPDYEPAREMLRRVDRSFDYFA